MSDDTTTRKPHRETRDVWITPDEAPDWMRHATDEGSQSMRQDESQERMVEQMGVRVDDDYVLDDEIAEDERMIINMGPQHPSTHGVMRLQIELEGEIVRRVKPIIGYLHTGMEKTGENLMYMQGGTNVTRMDYIAPLFNELVFALATRILMTELNRTASHLVSLATQGMDIGALSMMLYGFRERELILAFFEKTTGLRMNHNFIRPGGVAADLPDGWEEDVEEIIEKTPVGVADYEDLLKSNPIWEGRTRNVGVISAEECLAYGITGPPLRATGIDLDLRKSQPYSGIEQYEFDVAVGSNGDVYDRYRVRVQEILQSLRIVKQVAEQMPAGDYRADDRKVTPPPRKRIDESMEALIHHFKLFTEGFKVPEGEAYVAIASPRGEIGCYLVSDGSAKPYRMHIRAPSFANLQGLPIMLADSLVADSVATIASVDAVMGDVDR